jgi:hypothetical protein
LAHEEDDRADRVLNQLALDLPDQLLTLVWVRFCRLLLNQRIDLRVAAGQCI